MVSKKHVEEITKLFAAFGQSSEGKRIAVYCQYLEDVPADVLETACKKAIMECKHLPSIAELVEFSKSLVAESNGTTPLPFAEAWKEITKELHDTFVYGTPKFSRPEIKQTVDAFGWQELCEMKTSEIPIIRAQLKSFYEAICERNKERNTNAYVLGSAVLIDTGNEVRLILK